METKHTGARVEVYTRVLFEKETSPPPRYIIIIYILHLTMNNGWCSPTAFLFPLQPKNNKKWKEKIKKEEKKNNFAIFPDHRDHTVNIYILYDICIHSTHGMCMCAIGKYISKNMYVYKTKKNRFLFAQCLYWRRVVYLILCEHGCESLDDLCEQKKEDNIVYILYTNTFINVYNIKVYKTLTVYRIICHWTNVHIYKDSDM